MVTLRTLATLLFAPVLAAAIAAAAPARADACLSQAEARQAVANGQAVSLSQIRAGLPGEVVSAALCSGSGGLVYVVNVLGAGGKVERITIDAQSGAIAGR